MPTIPAATTPRFAIDAHLRYQVDAPTDFIFQLHAIDGGDQRLAGETLQLRPALPHRVFMDERVGNRFLRLSAPPGPLSLRYRAEVEIDRPPPRPRAPEMRIAELPDEVLRYLMPTRYCESDVLASAACKMFGGLPQGRRRVQAVCDWIFDNIDYRRGSTDNTTTALEVFVQRAGVCRDFAHLGVTFCRALDIPARLAVGYAELNVPPPDFHAVFEAFLGGRWELFDPTRMCDVQQLVRIAVGRDAKDVAFATLFGAATLKDLRPLVSPV